MPARKQNASFDRQAAAAMFAQILDELRSGSDVERLNECRALFRAAVPFHLRSYAAAALILRALDSGAPGLRKGAREARRERQDQTSRRDEGRGASVQGASRQAAARDDAAAAPSRPPKDRGATARAEKAVALPEDRVEARIKEGRYHGEGVTIFLGMGRRQRFNARSIYRLLSERTELSEDQVGEIRGRDNYTFLVLAPEVVEASIVALDGATVKGRRLTVSLARKKEERPAGEEADRPAVSAADEGEAAYDMGAYGDATEPDEPDEPDETDEPEADGEDEAERL